MKNIRYKEILFLSYREKKARRLNLDSDVVVIKGGNGSGKSCLLKSLYSVFGAQVNKYPEGWDPHTIILLLKFQIDGIAHAAMRLGNDLYLLNPDNSFFSETNDILIQSEKLSVLLGLNLLYYSDRSRTRYLPLGCIFMPFYIDQDSGWQQPWSSFSQVGNEALKRNVMSFYTGVMDVDYFKSQSRLISLKNEYSRWNNEKNIQNKFIEIIKDKLESTTMSLSEDDFKEEIDEFILKIQGLKEKQNKILKELEELYFDKMFKENRIAKLHASIKEIEEDFKYALQEQDVLVCPVCGAHAENTSLARLAMNVDRQECRDAILRYKGELDSINSKIEFVRGKSDSLKKQIEDIETLVTTKKEEYTLKEYLDTRVVEKLHQLFKDNELEFDDRLECLEEEIRCENEILKDLKASSRQREILKDFNTCLEHYSCELGSYLDVRKNHSLGEKIKGSGSSHPKETLAYFFAYLHVMQKYSTPIMMPIVVDEFKQNGTTDYSIGKMMDFSISHKPKNGQIIYSISDDYSVQQNESKVILLEGNHLMIDEDFVSVKNEIEEILTLNFRLRST